MKAEQILEKHLSISSALPLSDTQKHFVYLAMEEYAAQFQPPQVTVWVNTKDKLPLHGVPVLGFNPDWVDADFNPKGISECHLYGEKEWCVPVWNPEYDEWTTKISEEYPEVIPTHWMPLPTTPTG